MPANYSKKIVCLANSRKPGGRCIAGREVVNDGYGGWIRPVSVRPSAEVNLDERRYENGTDPQILDVVSIAMIAPVPKLHQTENHMLDAEHYWSRQGSLTWNDLPRLEDTPAALWINEGSTYHGVNDCVTAATAQRLAGSLSLIRPPRLNVMVQLEGGMFGPARRRVRADFQYNGMPYRFMVTDPIVELLFLAGEDGVFQVNDAYLCVSLTEPFDGDGRCHKLVATIISQRPLR